MIFDEGAQTACVVESFECQFGFNTWWNHLFTLKPGLMYMLSPLSDAIPEITGTKATLQNKFPKMILR